MAEPASDLAIASLASAAIGKSLAAKFVAIGEISLSGEIRMYPTWGREAQ
ncbi:hypothetical protein [Brevibacterium sp. UCMA 11754]|nr:hypothetical protein [Brevibacterium sp. UCMA 11754]